MKTIILFLLLFITSNLFSQTIPEHFSNLNNWYTFGAVLDTNDHTGSIGSKSVKFLTNDTITTKNFTFEQKSVYFFYKSIGTGSRIILYYTTDFGSNWVLYLDTSPSGGSWSSLGNGILPSGVDSIKFVGINILLDDITYNEPFPVKLESFICVSKNDGIKLQWITSIEENNSHFEIYRDNEFIGKVPGAGNSNTQQTYTFEDKVLKYKDYSYRLRQVDYNGNFEDLDTMTVSFENQFEIFTTYPNPSNGNINFKISSLEEQEQFLKVYDSLGRLVLNQKISLYKGINIIPLEFKTSGIYFLSVGKKSLKFLIVN